MKYSARIMVEGDADNIVKLFEPETKKFTNNRAAYFVKKNKDKTEFIITAEDSTALRAVANSIIKNLTIYEKTKWIKKQKIK